MPEAKQPIVVEGPFPKATTMRLHLMTVSSKATLVARADGEKVWERSFVCGPGESEWKTVKFMPQWKNYQNVYDRDYTFEIPAGAKRVELAQTDGDWCQIGELGIRPADGREDVLTLHSDWNGATAHVRYASTPSGGRFTSQQGSEDRQWLKTTAIAPWKEAEKQGLAIMVGEFGSYNRTPHDVVLAWMEDCLANWKEAGWGWALWNFRGSFGILDSERTDVRYEEFQGHKLDRKMLELLQRF